MAKKIMISIKIDEDLKSDIKRAAKAFGSSLTAYIVAAVKQRLIADQKFIQDWEKIQNMNKEEK